MERWEMNKTFPRPAWCWVTQQCAKENYQSIYFIIILYPRYPLLGITSDTNWRRYICPWTLFLRIFQVLSGGILTSWTYTVLSFYYLHVPLSLRDKLGPLGTGPRSAAPMNVNICTRHSRVAISVPNCPRCRRGKDSAATLPSQNYTPSTLPLIINVRWHSFHFSWKIFYASGSARIKPH